MPKYIVGIIDADKNYICGAWITPVIDADSILEAAAEACGVPVEGLWFNPNVTLAEAETLEEISGCPILDLSKLGKST